MKKIFLIILFCLFLFSCTTTWENAAIEYKCTNEQMIKVQNETNYCIGKDIARKFYCYNSAIIRNCNKIGEK